MVAYGAAAGREGISPPAVPATTGVDSNQEAIIIDHTCTDLGQIPDYWLAQAKELALHYAHTSHGSQINSGLEALEGWNPKYDHSVFDAGDSPPSALSCAEGTLCIYDGNPPETYIEPDDYWSTEDGRDRTVAVADTGLFGFSMWSWCGQQSDNSTDTVQFYLDTLDLFEQEYPDMRFIYMTGHTDGGSDTLTRNNNMVRDYVQAQGKVLFDFADIESYDPDGTYYQDTDDSCPWCDDWCTAHPEDCIYVLGDCAHSHPFNCVLKGRAFWWMMARLAGWDGVVGAPDFSPSLKSAFPRYADYGEQITYMVEIRNVGALLDNTVRLTDVVPAGLAYVPGTLTATAGTVNDAEAPTLLWVGALSSTPAVTVSYVVEVTAGSPQAITNRAEVLMEPGYWGDPPVSTHYYRPAAIIANPLQAMLPLVLRGG
jgi:uncharacterized repeat protein (TIGR01451 family)